MTTALETEMTNLRVLVVDLLDQLEDHIGAPLFSFCKGSKVLRSRHLEERDKLRLLLQYSRKLSAFQKRATLVQECLEEVLENGASPLPPNSQSTEGKTNNLDCVTDDDLAAMYLTAKANGAPRDPSEHEEIEMLLESFSKQCEEIVSEVESLSVRFPSENFRRFRSLMRSFRQANTRHTEDIIELMLDANRNSLLGLDLKVSICTLGLTSGALIAGLFGMVSSSSPYLCCVETDTLPAECSSNLLILSFDSRRTLTDHIPIAVDDPPRATPLRLPSSDRYRHDARTRRDVRLAQEASEDASGRIRIHRSEFDDACGRCLEGTETDT